MGRWVTAKRTRPTVTGGGASYLPIREQHAAPRVWLAVAFVGHPEVGPADPIAAGDEPAERVVEARLAAHRDAPDPRPRGGGLRRRDARLERAVVARRELEHAHLVLGPAFGEGGGVPQDERREPVVAVHERRVAQPQLGGEDDLAREVVAGGERADEATGRRERRAARVPFALRQQ